MSEWEPGVQEYIYATSLLDDAHKAKVARFMFDIDKKRSIVGRLAMKKVISLLTGLPFEEIHFIQNAFQKPFWKPPVSLYYNSYIYIYIYIYS